MVIQQELPASVGTALSEVKKVLAEIYGERLRGLYLYGSYARGDFSEDSDVDLVIALEGEVNPYEEIAKFSGLVSDICLKHNVLIATYPVSEDWLRQRQSPLMENVRREGVLL